MNVFKAIFLLLFVSNTGYSQQDTIKNTKDSILIELIEQTIDSSTIYYNSGIFTKSLMSNIKLLDLAKQSKNPRYLSKAHRFLAYDFLIVGDTLLARENLENSRKYAEIFNDDLTVGLSYMDLANYHSRSDLDYKKALKYHEISITKIKKSKDSIELAKAYYNTIITAFYSEQYDIGLKYLKILGSPGFDKYKPDYFSSSEKTYWATYYNENGQYLQAEKVAREALILTKDNGTPAEKYDAYEQLAVSFYGQKRYKEAYDYRLSSEYYFDESQGLIQDEQSQAALAKLKVEQYKNQIADQKEKTALQAEIAESKNNLNNILIIVCLGGLLLFIALFVAYTKRRDLNLALRKKNEEYLQAKEKSELLAKAKSKFFSTVSHELRTPLYGVIGLSSILLEDPKLKSHEKDLKSLKFSADYLLALINDVLQINKIDSNNLENELSQFNIREFIQSITATFEYMRLQNKNKIVVKIDSKIPEYLQGNVVRLSQILMNLVGNALKFTENGTITISLILEELKDNNDYNILFSITDTGIGIPKDKQATIFDEFTQVESLNYVYQGTGLGLPIVKKLLQASNSNLLLESELGKGTKVSFDLNFKEVTKHINTVSKPLLNESLLQDKKILVAEDNRINQIVTKKILEKKGVICSIAENGDEAVNLIKNNHFDLILMDLNMPIMNGFEATIETRKFNSTIPIIALTAVEVEEVRNEIYAAGMDDIIVKPYDDSQFTRIILENLISKNYDK
ncbi:histidine kinase [Patiriisocius marinus]|uniref:histidine kinase n=1 Tax=Patiriisocius marinus TaxID=1397112 RepID=A0A5J4IND6_9FLAO|nr:response regulator [Patiriisocius marinus]GER58869.1 histidine kinase [Patiriisocius marinus]